MDLSIFLRRRCRTRIQSKNLQNHSPGTLVEHRKIVFRRFIKLHLNPLQGRSCISFRSIRQGLSVGKIGLHIIHRSTIDEIDPGEMENRWIHPVPAFHTDAIKSNKGQSESIRTVRGATRKHPHPVVAPKAGRPDRRVPTLSRRLVESENQPDMGESR